jgi:hypothetical protein
MHRVKVWIANPSKHLLEGQSGCREAGAQID